tara:strand:+ start:822 stop:1037 length:216 start_codon:yes stop_codon:yes gene_type:complete
MQNVGIFSLKASTLQIQFVLTISLPLFIISFQSMIKKGLESSLIIKENFLFPKDILNKTLARKSTNQNSIQ